MSKQTATVLFDAPGPRAIARYRAYSVLSAIVLVAFLALLLRQMNSTGQLAYAKWEYFVTPTYVQTILVDGVLNTLKAAVLAILGALALGIVFGTGKLASSRWVRWPSWLYVEFFRAVPLLLLIIYVYYSISIGGGVARIWPLVIGLALYNGAVLAEIVRAGIQSLPAGQTEAGLAIGMTPGQVTRIIQLPQAIKVMLPAMISQFVVCLKDTSLGYAIGAPGLTVVMKQISQEGRNQVQTALVMAALYIAMNLVVTAVAHWAQRRYVGQGTGAAAAADETV